MINRFLEKKRWRFLKPELVGDKPILDIGCRDKRFINQFPNGIGIDKDGTKKNRLKFGFRQFSYVTMFAVVEHIDYYDMFKLQKEIHRVLENHGLLVITTPAKFSHPLLKFLAFIRLISKKDIDEHVSYYNKYNILGIFTKFKLYHYERFDIFNQLFVLRKYDNR